MHIGKSSFYQNLLQVNIQVCDDIKVTENLNMVGQYQQFGSYLLDLGKYQPYWEKDCFPAKNNGRSISRFVRQQFYHIPRSCLHNMKVRHSCTAILIFYENSFLITRKLYPQTLLVTIMHKETFLPEFEWIFYSTLIVANYVPLQVCVIEILPHLMRNSHIK